MAGGLWWYTPRLTEKTQWGEIHSCVLYGCPWPAHNLNLAINAQGIKFDPSLSLHNFKPDFYNIWGTRIKSLQKHGNQYQNIISLLVGMMNHSMHLFCNSHVPAKNNSINNKI